MREQLQSSEGAARPSTAASAPLPAVVPPMVAPTVARPDRPGPALNLLLVSRLSTLAGNRAVSGLLRGTPLSLQRDGPDAGTDAAAPAKPPPRHTWVFIMGTDPPGTKNPFFTHAKAYYDGLYGSAANSHVAVVSTLEQVMGTVNSAGDPVGLLIVVSHGHPDGTLLFDLGVTPTPSGAGSLPTTPAGGTPTQYDTTKAAVQQGKLSTPDVKIIDAQTKIVIKGCNIGRSQRMVAVLKAAFGGRAEITASTHAQEFGGGQEHLAEYYVERPGTATLAAATLAKEFETKYAAHVPNMDAKAWAGVAAQATRETETDPFEVYRGIVPDATDAAFQAGFSAQIAGLAAQGATSIKFIKRTLNGTMYDYEYGAKLLVNGSAQATTGAISIEAPPDDATAIAQAKAESGRPEAYEFAVKKSKQGKETVVTVEAKRTEWKLKHIVIKDKSGSPIAPPADTDAFWYTKEAATPPAAPATP